MAQELPLKKVDDDQNQHHHDIPHHPLHIIDTAKPPCVHDITTTSTSNGFHNTCTPSSNQNDTNSSFKFNAQAPEFVPRSHTPTSSSQMPISGFFYPCFHYLGATAGSDWFFVGDQDPHAYLISNPNLTFPNSSNKTTRLTDDLRQKILKQVEYQFSDMSLLANESMSKHISKDPEGYVPISVIASTKKMKSLINNNQLLAQALQSSTKLVVSEDGKKVKRQIPFTEKDREELQSRTIVVENLPEDHSHQNIEKIFGVVGSIRSIRICHPQEPNSSRSTRSDFFMSNKLHALVEFENPEIAERAVEKLNDERNWRKGLRVRVLLRCSPKSVLKSKKSEFDGILDDEDITPESVEDSSHTNNAEHITENNVEENSGSSKKGWGKGRGKVRGRGQSHGGRGLLSLSPQAVSAQSEASAKHTFKGPRMPDGTRGFALGRGKPLSSPSLATSMVD